VAHVRNALLWTVDGTSEALEEQRRVLALGGWISDGDDEDG